MSWTRLSVVLLALALASACRPANDDDDTTAAISDDDDTTPVPDDDDTADDDDVVDDDDSTECEPDDDGDGYVDAACGGDDCDDGNPDVHPGAVEVCANGLDDDCDGACIGCGLCGEHPLALADAKLLGEFVSAGSWVAPAGDVDHDGFDDIMVTSGRSSTAEPLKRYIVAGPQYGTSSLSAAAVQLEGWGTQTPGARNVTSGDFNGDGERDFASGFRWQTSIGVVYGPQSGAVDMADHTLLGPPSIADGSTCSVASAGDVDGDGMDDLLVGARGFGGGGAFLYSGPIVSSPDGDGLVATLLAGLGNVAAGYTVAGGGDINNDGYDDLLIGDINHSGSGDEAGAVHVVYGPVTGEHSLADADATLLGVACSVYDAGSGEWLSVDSDFGYSIAVDDMNGDGFDDVIVGAPGAGLLAKYGECAAPGHGGVVYVFHGPLGGTVDAVDADVTLAIASSGSQGWSVASAGDVNADGASDLLIGAPNMVLESTSLVGGAYLVYGPLHGDKPITAPDVTFAGENTDFGEGHAGVSVTGGGDINNDGYDDIVIGDTGEDEAGDFAGAAYILYGGPGY